ncbi:MAG: Ig-like domain-containing protein, partial [Campylobacterota bacterium]|nr:Ig-like domain-containing protein [Campylobacterota bacterium]
MANEIEGAGQHAQEEIIEKEDEISKQGGLGVNLESFTNRGVFDADAKRGSQNSKDDKNQVIDENVQNFDLDETTIGTLTATQLATYINDGVLLGSTDIDVLISQDTNIDISQEEALGLMADQVRSDANEAQIIADEARVAAQEAQIVAQELNTQEAIDAAQEAEQIAQEAQEVAEQLEEEAQIAEETAEQAQEDQEVAQEDNTPDDPNDPDTPNTAPTVGDIVDQTVAEDSGLRFSFDAFDAQDDTLTSYVVGTNGLAYIDDNGQIVFNPDANYNGPASVTLVVSDGNGGVVTKVVNITVDPVNDAPTIDTIVTQTVDQDGEKIISFSANDIDNTQDELSSSVTALNGTVVIDENGDISYSPNEGYVGNDVVTLTVDDGNGGVTSQSFSVVVSEGAPDVNDALTLTVTPTTADFVEDA